MSWFEIVYQPRLNRCKDKNGKLIEDDEAVIRWIEHFCSSKHWNSAVVDVEKDEEHLTLDQPIIKEPTKELEMVFGNLKSNKVPDVDKLVFEWIKKLHLNYSPRVWDNLDGIE